MARSVSQPVIGIVPSFDEGNNIPAGSDVKRVYIRHEYMNQLAMAGAVPIILHPDMTTATITDLCDGIVISGGEDIEPHFMAPNRWRAPGLTSLKAVSSGKWN